LPRVAISVRFALGLITAIFIKTTGDSHQPAFPFALGADNEERNGYPLNGIVLA
jgi:hypothetical protein